MAGINYTISADASKANREMSSFEKKTRKIVDSISKGFKERIGHKLFDGLIGAARAVPGMLNEAIDSASSLNEEVSKSETIFGSSSAEIQKWAKGAAEAMGLSEVAALEATGTIGNMFVAMGMSGDQAANMSKSMVQLASDLGSFNNTSTDDAIQAIGAALRGESEPIRRYGVLLDDATLKAEAFAKGLYDGKGSLDPATRALSAYSVILKQTTAAQGDFQKTSDGLANSQKILKAQFANASTEIGKALLPAMQSLVNMMREMDMESFAQSVGNVASAFINLGKEITAVYDKYLQFVRFVAETSGLETKITTPESQTKDLVSGIGLAGVNPAAKQRLRDSIRRSKEASSLDSKGTVERVSDAPAILEISEPIEAEIKSDNSDEKYLNGLKDSLLKLQNTSTLSSINAVSSMQRIGGGGGVSTQLDYQKRQAQLQEQMVSLLSEIKERQKPQSISDY